jgi:inner membrane protein
MRVGILIGSVLPDLDLLWFYGPGERAVNHHFYPTHLLWFWLLVALRWRGVALGAILHLALDTVAGGIAWLHPFSRELFVLFEVPRRDGFWVWSFVLHPTFLLEIAIVAVSARRWRSGGAPRRALPSTSPS